MSSVLPTVPVLHSEWLKIRSLRGTVGSLAAVLAATAGIQALVSATVGQAEADNLGGDPLFWAFYGINFGQVAAIAFGATAVSAEFHQGGLRTSLTAVPNRTRLYLSKIAVVAGLMFVVGQLTGLATFLGGQALMGSYALDLGAPGTYRAVVGSGLYLMLMALFAAGLTAVLRSAAVVLSLLIPFVLIASFVIGAAASSVGRYLPDQAGQVVLHQQATGSLGPWSGLAVTALWAAAALGLGWLSLRRRDA
ncbi:ABC transporter permease [Streptomyces sp. NPDC090445]|uniref:ABC transporter permease n=1 Tax=Streptomyces sp. NPDC090445 TaxID=3365963 RepID=UPI003830B98A